MLVNGVKALTKDMPAIESIKNRYCSLGTSNAHQPLRGSSGKHSNLFTFQWLIEDLISVCCLSINANQSP